MLSYRDRFNQSNKTHKQSVESSLSRPDKIKPIIERTQHGNKLHTKIFKTKNKKRKNLTKPNRNISQIKKITNAPISANKFKKGIQNKKLSFANLKRKYPDRAYISNYDKQSEIALNQSRYSNPSVKNRRRIANAINSGQYISYSDWNYGWDDPSQMRLYSSNTINTGNNTGDGSLETRQGGIDMSTIFTSDGTPLSTLGPMFWSWTQQLNPVTLIREILFFYWDNALQLWILWELGPLEWVYNEILDWHNDALYSVEIIGSWSWGGPKSFQWWLK